MIKAESTFAQLLREQSVEFGDRPAILAPGRSALTYGALWTQVNLITGALQASGATEASRVAVVLPNGPEMAVTFLAVSSCATCVPLNPASRESEFSFYFEDMRADTLVVLEGDDSPARAAAGKLGLKVIELRRTVGAAAGAFEVVGIPVSPPAAPRFAPASNVALVLHTSGTTARPKIVPLTQFNLIASARNIASHLRLTPDDRVLNVMPLFHIHGMIGALLSTMASGGSVVCSPGFKEDEFWEWVRDFQPTWYTAVPTIHQSVVAAGDRYRLRAPDHRFRFIRSSSSSLPPATMRALEALTGAPVIEAYGMTEASHQMTSNALPPGARLAGSVGVAAGVEVAIVDDKGQRLGVGQLGEIVIRGPSVIKGYENNPAANASSFFGEWFRTGDQGALNEDGQLFISGRIKEIVNRGGEKVSPREIDEALLEHPQVLQATAFGVPHPTLGEDLAVAVVRRGGASLDESEVRRYLASRLSDFKVPSRVLFVDAIPKGATGKVQRVNLHKALHDQLASAYVAPSSETEDRLAQAWAKVLKVERVGLTDNFFALGGNSLGVVRLVEEMQRSAGLRFELADVFRNPSISSLLASTSKPRETGQSLVVPLQPQGDGVPVFCLYGISIYQPFADCLGKDQPVYGVYVHEEQAIVNQVIQGKTPQFSIRSLVSAYAKEIERVRPHGPYRLAGFSFGGILAIELAELLRSRGEAVEIVMLLDTVLGQSLRRNWMKWFGHRAGQVLRGEFVQAWRKSLARRRQAAGKSPSGADDGDVTQWQTEAFRRVARRWRPTLRHVDFPIVLFRATERSRWAPYEDVAPDYGWTSIVGERLRIVDVPGVHLKIVERPSVEVLAGKARELMAGAGAA